MQVDAGSTFNASGSLAVALVRPREVLIQSSEEPTILLCMSSTYSNPLTLSLLERTFLDGGHFMIPSWFLVATGASYPYDGG